LRHDLHALGRTGLFGFVQVKTNILLKDTVVSVLVEHHQPILAHG
jgi:hypothetical protein